MAISKTQMKAMQRRGSSDIDRLAQQYQKDIAALTGDYEKSFMGTQAEREKQLQPYNLATEQYKTAMADYDTQAAAYRSKLGEYQAAVTSAEKNPMTKIGYLKPEKGTRNYFVLENGVKKYTDQLDDANYFVEGLEVFKKNTPPVFTEKAPTAPKAPEMPELAGLDETKFDTRRGELETTFKREVGERKAARLGAVSRRTARPMLQGA